MKICSLCNMKLLEEDFAIINTIPKKIHRRKYCKKCHNKRQSVRIKLHKENYTKGITCDICKTECKTVLDHNHNNNKFRGWLCTRCNTGIGLFDDDTKLLQEAINYIKNSETECI